MSTVEPAIPDPSEAVSGRPGDHVGRRSGLLTYTALGALMDAYRAQLASQNHAIDGANGAAASYNSGQAKIADALKTEAQAAVADAEAQTAAVHGALVEVKQAFAALQRAAG